MPSILIIDDDVALLARLAAQLEEAGLPIARTSDLAHAEALYAAERPDLVILEVRAHDGAGWGLLERIAAETAVIVLSAAGTEEDVVRGIEAGAADYIAKPYRAAELLARVRARLATSLTAVAAPTPATADTTPLTEAAPKRNATKRRNGKQVDEDPVFMSEAEEMALLRLPPAPVDGRERAAPAPEAYPDRSFGQRMRAERQRRHLTLVQAENELRIRMSYLQAIEDEKFTLLPRGPAALQMVRSYAEFLGLDAAPILDEFRTQHYVEASEPHPALGGSRPARPLPRWIVLLAAVALALLICLGAILLLDPGFFSTAAAFFSGLWAQLLGQFGP